ncbi:MAG TPA: hypothetical protein VI636_12260 [Candidatus Angelobacter sp.]
MPSRDTDITRILSRNQMDFVYHWKGDAVEAARAAGYSDPKSAAFKLMQYDIICELIRKKQLAIAEEAGKAIGRQLSFYRSDVINRLWELAKMSPSNTGGNITGQIRASEALANILSVGNHIDSDNQALATQLRSHAESLPTGQDASSASELAAASTAPQLSESANEIVGFLK